MPETTPPGRDDPKLATTAIFNAMAEKYDTLRFLQLTAARLVDLANLSPGQCVLDVATGTGIAAMLAAKAVGPSDCVVGVDLSEQMLAQAREKLARDGIEYVTLRIGDAEHLDLADGSFNVVLCASSLFIMPDMPAVVREWRRVLVPGGKALFSSFELSLFEPLRELFNNCLLRHGVKPARLPIHRLADPEVCRRLLEDAGFEQVRVMRAALNYHLPTPEARWADIEFGLEGLPLAEIDPQLRERIKSEHLVELEPFVTLQGIDIHVPAIFTSGVKAQMPV